MKKSPDKPSRRKLVSGAGLGALLGAGKVLPTHWQRPLVDSVAVPAHAATTGPCSCSDTYCDGLIITVNNGVVMVTQNGTASGPCNPDGTFSFALPNNLWIEGTIAADCSVITGRVCSDSTCSSTLFPFEATPEGECIGGLCLLHGSLIVMTDGTNKTVEQLQLGDQVLSFEPGYGITPTEVTLVMADHPREAHYKINGELRITNDHPVLVQQGDEARWLPVQDLAVGMQLHGLDQVVTVENIEYIEGKVLTAYVETESGSFITVGRASYVVQSSYGQGLLTGDLRGAIHHATAA